MRCSTCSLKAKPVPRSCASVVIAISQPWFTAPMTCARGTGTASRNTSLNSVEPVICRSGRMVMPGLLHVEDEVGEAAVLRQRRVGAREQDRPARELGVARPHLLAADAEPVAVALGARAHRGEIAAGVRLAEELAPDLVAGEDRREQAALLRLGAVRDERRAGVVDADAVQQLRRARARQLLVQDRLLDWAARRGRRTRAARAGRRSPRRGAAAASRAGTRTPRPATRRRAARARRARAGSSRATRAASRGTARRPASRRSPRRASTTPRPRAMLGAQPDMRFGLVTPIVTRHPQHDAAWTEDAGPEEIARIARGRGSARLSSPHLQRARRHSRRRGARRAARATTTRSRRSASSPRRRTRIRFVTHVLVLGYHHPLEIAKRYGTLDRLCGGRLVLGRGRRARSPRSSRSSARSSRIEAQRYEDALARAARVVRPPRAVVRWLAPSLRRGRRRSVRGPGGRARSGSVAARRRSLRRALALGRRLGSVRPRRWTSSTRCSAAARRGREWEARREPPSTSCCRSTGCSIRSTRATATRSSRAAAATATSGRPS